jgi:hypothetical protein
MITSSKVPAWLQAPSPPSPTTAQPAFTDDPSVPTKKQKVNRRRREENDKEVLRENPSLSSAAPRPEGNIMQKYKQKEVFSYQW